MGQPVATLVWGNCKGSVPLGPPRSPVRSHSVPLGPSRSPVRSHSAPLGPPRSHSVFCSVSLSPSRSSVQSLSVPLGLPRSLSVFCSVGEWRLQSKGKEAEVSDLFGKHNLYEEGPRVMSVLEPSIMWPRRKEIICSQ